MVSVVKISVVNRTEIKCIMQHQLSRTLPVTTFISFLHQSENYGKIIEKAGDFKRNRESWINFVKSGSLPLKAGGLELVVLNSLKKVHLGKLLKKCHLFMYVKYVENTPSIVNRCLNVARLTI